MAPPPPARSSGPRTLRAATAHSLAIDAATVEAVERLDQEGIRALLLKGPALASLLYDPGEERSWSDADLLVAPGEHDRALEALERIGFHPRISDPLERDSVPHAVHLVRSAAPVPGGPAAESIDLHRGFAGVEAGYEALWRSLSAATDRVELFGRRIEVPTVPARLALVSLHAAAHGREHTRSRRDLERALTRFGDAPWQRAAALARDWDALDYFVAGLGLDPAGDRLRARLGIEHGPSRAALMRAQGMPRAQRSIEQLARARGLRRLRVIARKLVPSPQVMRTWQPIARRGRAGLALAYAWRPLWLLAQLPPAIAAYRRAGRA